MAEDKIEEYKGRGVLVPHGLKASWIMEGAWVLESEQFDVAPFTSRSMVKAILEVVLPLIQQDETEDESDLESAIPIPISPKIDRKIRSWMISLGIDPDAPPAPDWNNG